SGHAVAFARLQLPDGRDDAAHRRVDLDRLAPAGSPAVFGFRRRLRIGKVHNGLRTELAQRAGVPIHRMAAPIQAKGFLLKRELLGLGPRCRVRQGSMWRDGVKAVPYVRRAVLVSE